MSVMVNPATPTQQKAFRSQDLKAFLLCYNS